jgi:hypothetical protein
MRKLVRTVILSVCFFSLFITCKNYSESIDDYLSYWSTAAAIETYTFNPEPHTDAKGTQWVSSTASTTVTFTVRNPKNFELKDPADSSAPADSITFPYDPAISGATAPQANRDYTFKKISNTEFELTYTSVFLQQYEWGSVDITPTIVLHTADGRMFKQTIPFTLKVNTPPPAIEKCVIAQTKTASAAEPAYYVLCLQLPAAEMNRKLNGSLVHKDIAGITINETSYSLSIDSAQRQLNVKAGSPFIGKDSVEKLAAADAEEIPSGWTLYFKTDVAVGDAKKAYTISVKDEKGLYSKPVTAATQLSDPQPAQAAVITGTKIDSLSMDGTAQDKAIVIKAADAAPKAQIKLSVPATGVIAVTDVTIHYTLTEVGQTSAPEQTGTSPITVDMPLNGAGEKMYALAYFTDGVGFKPSASKTVYYKVVKEHTVTFNLAGGNIDGKTNDITMTDIQGMPFTAPANPRRDGYTFTGWNPALSSTPKFSAADTTYTAQWTAHRYKVQFNGNGSTAGSMSEQEFTYDISQALQHNGFDKTGYTFRGWANASTATEPVYIDAQRVTNLSSSNNAVVQLFAVWQINTYTVTFSVDGGNGTLSATPQGRSENSTGTITVEHGKSVIFTATPTEGWEVDSWTGVTPDTSSPDTTKATLSSVINTTTVTVKFKKKQAKEVSDWEALRTAVKKASDGDVIEVTGNITYGFTGTESTITVKSNITIKSKGSNKYTLDANGKGANNTASNAKSTGIFEVENGKTLTLEKVTLTKTEKYAVYVEEDSSLIMTNVTITDCKTNYNAAGIYFNKGKKLMLTDCTIEKCKGKGGNSSGGIDIQEPKETVSIKNTKIKNCEVTGTQSTGGGIHLYKGTCTLTNVIIQECKAPKGGGMCVNAGTLTITGGSFTKNKATGTGTNIQGGAIYSEGGSLTLKGCMIGGNTSDEGNTAKKGGGIYLKNVTLTMEGVTVKNNKALTQGGGIYLAGGELKIPGGNTIADNSIIDNGNSEAGGGIYVEKGMLTLDGGIIFGNSANANKGGGVYLKAGTFTMNSGEIKNCSAKYGGGVSLAGTSTFTMTGGTITGCKADVEGGKGGGIYTELKTKLTLEGAASNPVVISNCTAKETGGGMHIHTQNTVTVKNARIEENSANSGGGVYLEQGTFTIAGSTRITPSTETTAGQNDVFLKEGKFITISGALTAESPIARITPENYTVGAKVLEASSTECAKFTVTPKDGNAWSIDQNGKLKSP